MPTHKRLLQSGADAESIEARIERLRHVKVSREVALLLESDFSHSRESQFLLFRNEATGIIDLVVESAQPSRRGSFGFPRDQVSYYERILGEEGHVLVGTYHSHTDTDDEIAQKRQNDFYGPRKAEYDPTLLSPDDQYPFDDGNLDQIKLLGHRSENLCFRMRGYIPVNDNGYQRSRATGDTRFLMDNLSLLRERGLIARHYRDLDNMELEISVVETGFDPRGAGIIGKHLPYVTERSFPIAAEEVEALRGRYGFREAPAEEGGFRLSVRSYATGRAEADIISSSGRLLHVGCEDGELARLESSRASATHVLSVASDDVGFLRQHLPSDASTLLFERS